MKKFTKLWQWLLLLMFFFVTVNVTLADNCTQTFSVSGQDDDPTVVTVLPGDITCTSGGTITGITLNNTQGSFISSFCGSWYDFDLIVDGSTVISGGCQADFDGTVISVPFTSIVVQSNDLDAYSDGVTITFDLDVVYTPPACPAPADLTASSITGSAADLSWTSSATLFDVKYNEAADFDPETQGTAVSPNPTSTSTTLTGLTSSTDVYWYVRADCGGSGQSTWAGPNVFSTQCAPVSLPFTEGFNSTSTTESCWTVLDVNGDGDEWDLNYTSNPYEGDEVAAMYTDYNAGDNDDYLITPLINLNGNQRIKFWYRVQSSGEPNDFELLLSTTGIGASDFTTVLVANTSYSNTSYQEMIVDLSAYSGDVNIAWHIPSGGLDGWRLYVDQVTVEDIPSCLSPTDLVASNISSSGADLSWTNPSGAPDFDVYIVTAGSPAPDPGTTPTVSGITTPYTWSGGSPGTAYDFYARANCTGGSSEWSLPGSFTTAFLAPFCEDFTGGYPPPIGWDEGTGIPTAPPVFGSSLWVEDGYLNVGTTGSAKVNIYGTTRDEWMFTPPTDLGTGGLNLEFDLALTDYGNSDPPTSVGDDDKFAVYISDDNFATFTELQMWDNTTTPAFGGISYTGEKVTLDITGYSGVVRIGFYGESTVSNADNDLFVDNICFVDPAATPDCSMPVYPLDAGIDVLPNGTLEWTPAAGATGYKIWFGSDGAGTVDPTNIENGTDLGDQTTYSFAGLSYSTDYYWKIVPYNGNGDAVGCEIWSFTTFTPVNANFCEYFDGVTEPDVPNGWSTILNSTASAAFVGTENLYSNTSPNSIEIYNSSDATAELYLVSPPFDPAFDLSLKQVTFVGRGSTTGYLLEIGTMSDPSNPASFTLIETVTLDVASFVSHTVYLSSYNGTDAYLAFRHGLGGTYRTMYIDDVCIEDAPDCLPPSNLFVDNVLQDQADINFEPQNSETTWHIEVGAPGFTPGTSTFIESYTYSPGGEPTPTITYTMTGLTASNTYDVYVQADCGSGSTSTWAGPVAFTTACASVVAPAWSEGFENAGTIPDCWSQGASNAEDWIFATTGGHVGDAGTIGGSTVTNSYFAYVDDSSPDNLGTTLQSPFIDVSALTLPMLQFYLISNNEGNSNVDFSVDVWDGAAWNTVYTSNSNTLNGEWELKSVVLDGITITGDIQIRFIVDEVVSGDFYDDVAIDDVTVIEAPLPGTLEGYVYQLDGTSPIENAVVTILQTGQNTTTNASGFYTMSVYPGTFDVSASMTLYEPSTVSGVVITESTTTTQDFNLAFGNNPQSLAAVGTDGQIDLAWAEPLPVSLSIQYDNNVVNSWGYAGAPSATTDMFAQKFTAPEAGNITDILMLNGVFSTPETWENIIVVPDDGSGNPDLTSPIETFTNVEVTSTFSSGGEWEIITLTSPYAVSAGSVFWVVMQWPVNTEGSPLVAIDDGTNANNVSYASSDGGTTWGLVNFSYGYANFFVRAYYTTSKGVLTQLKAGDMPSNAGPLPVLENNPDEKMSKLEPKPYDFTEVSSGFIAPPIMDMLNGTDALTGYNIYRGTDPGTLSYFDNTSTLMFTDNTISNNQRYYYAVSAVYDEGESSPSNISSDFGQTAQSVGFSSDFESTDGAFFGEGDWAWGAPSVVGPPAAYSGSNLWGTVLDGDYSVDAYDWLYQTFDLSAGGDYTFRFFSWIDLEDGFDEVRFAVDPENDGLFTILETWTGEELAWGEKFVQIPDAYTSAYTRVAFIFESDGSVVQSGFYFDDVALETYSPPVIASGPASFTETVVTNGNAFSSMTVSNTGDFPLDYTASIEYLGITTYLDETFDTEIPASWTQVLYSGTGVWSWTNTTTSFLGSDGSFAQANDDATAADYDVGLFTPSMDLTGETNVVVEFDRNFQDFAGSGIATVNVYSGGTGVANFEEELLFLTEDDAGGTGSGGGVHTLLSFDPSTYADPSNVYIEFYYTDEAYSGAWFFKIDNVTVYAGILGYITLDGSSDAAGYINPSGAADEIMVGFDAVGIPAGTYNANINIASNDPVNPTVTIPVTLNVINGIAAELTVLLEGPYDAAGVMTTDLNSGGYIPTSQPYNPALPYYDNPSPEWLYAGSEVVTAIPDGAVDWVLVQVRDAADAGSAGSTTIEATQAAFLMSDGSIMGLDGMSRLAFPGVTIDNGLFMVVYHRNHLGIMSASALTNPGGFYDYDFSSGETQVYGGANGHKELEPGYWGMIAADGNGNGLVQNTDETAVWKLDLGGSGYQGGDFNMNGLTQNTDETDVWKPNLGGGGQVPAKSSDTGYQSQIPK